MTDSPGGPSKTFDFANAQVSGNVFEEINSTADELVSAPGGEITNNRWSRIAHPATRAGGDVNWAAVTGIGTIALVIIAVVTLLLT